MLFNISNSIRHVADSLCILIRDSDIEFFFQFHYQFNHVK